MWLHLYTLLALLASLVTVLSDNSINTSSLDDYSLPANIFYNDYMRDTVLGSSTQTMNKRQGMFTITCQVGTPCGKYCINNGLTNGTCCDQLLGNICPPNTLCATNGDCVCQNGLQCGDPKKYLCLPDGFICCSAETGKACKAGHYCVESGCCKDGHTCINEVLECRTFDDIECQGSHPGDFCCPSLAPFCEGNKCTNKPTNESNVAYTTQTLVVTTTMMDLPSLSTGWIRTGDLNNTFRVFDSTTTLPVTISMKVDGSHQSTSRNISLASNATRIIYGNYSHSTATGLSYDNGTMTNDISNSRANNPQAEGNIASQAIKASLASLILLIISLIIFNL